MSENTLKNVIRRTLLPAEEYYAIAFQGGEPTLCGTDFFRRCVDLVKKYNRHGAKVSFFLQTNGQLIDEEWCCFFAENNFLIGLSVDGTAAIHDRFRKAQSGESSYRRALESAELMTRHHVDFNILTVVHRDVARHAQEIYEAYRRHGWRYLQFIACLDPCREAPGKMPWSLLPEDYGQFLVTLFDLWFADVQKGCAPYIRRFHNYIGLLRGHLPDACEQCGVCGDSFVIESDGSVYPCDFYVLDGYSIGNLNTDRLPDCASRRKELRFIERSVQLPEACLSCQWLRLCRGACYRTRDVPDSPEGRDYYCLSYRMLFDSAFERMKQIANGSSLTPRA